MKAVLLTDIEPELVTLIHIPRRGVKLCEGADFESIENLAKFFEDVFGSTKTYNDWTGELSTVIFYPNRLREVKKDIYKSVKQEKRIRHESVGAHGAPETFRAAREQMLDLKRGFVYSITDDEDTARPKRGKGQIN